MVIFIMDIEGIILAAGFSSRAGTFKMALDFHGKTVIENCIESMDHFCSKIYVVGGYKIEIVKEILKNYKNVQIVFNNNYEEGMLSSVKEGISHLKGEKFFLIPGDYPLVNKKTYEELMQVNGDIVIPLHNGRKGHPVFMKTSIACEILKNNEFESLKDFINSKGFVAVEVFDEGVLMDIDTFEDYKSLIERK